jgi:hypothetical protein
VKDDFAEAADVNEETEKQTDIQPSPETQEPPAGTKAAPAEIRPLLAKALEGLGLAAAIAVRVLRRAGSVSVRIAGFLRRKFKKDSAPGLVLTMILLTVIAAATAGLVHDLTEPRIARARERETAAAMLTVFPGEDLRFTPSTLGDSVYEGRDADGRLTGFSIIVSVRGNTGPVRMVVGIDIAREVTGVAVISHRELGGLPHVLEQGVSEALALFDRGVRQ